MVTKSLAWRGIASMCLALSYVSPVGAADGTPAQTRPLRVVTGPLAPFVFKQGDQYTGFSIDLWNELARRMRVDFVWVDAGSRADQLDSVPRGDADVAISAIVMTPERERIADFSQSYFDSGLQIMVRAEEESPILAMLAAIPWKSMGKLFGVAMVLVFIWANVLWFIERRRGGNSRKGYAVEIGNQMWNTLLIIATGEHGERSDPGALRRIVIACVWLMGIVLITQLTATVTSSQTVQRLRSTIAGPGDLPGKTVATVPGTVAAEYLASMHLPVVEVADAAAGIELLMHGKVQALVFDAPTLQYWAARSGKHSLQVVGPLFRPEKYGIVVALGSPLRKRINEALLEVYQDGTYEQIHERWFKARTSS
ncbi:transporter substrate-binding domain-containing protein [Variovorax sp. J2P1-59]|uniref:transporter substrate-binding domain-containing protein n=1 Tax=Variovorax flavidus TaxID=3053501 RepID=UPI0025778226|nr:transporter substrate-binding domain-containing protein [Variovorax sp. J2P1-59]MDM0073243.1 transporter substrate-binding domain-containing protein [Variovorax sp. J2P1-59]